MISMMMILSSLADFAVIFGKEKFVVKLSRTSFGAGGTNKNIKMNMIGKPIDL